MCLLSSLADQIGRGLYFLHLFGVLIVVVVVIGCYVAPFLLLRER